MVSPIHKALAAAVTMLLKPLVHILLRNGVSYGDFAEMAKIAYVDVANDEFRNGRSMTISRIAALTGLTRKEAKRLRELDRDSNADSYGRYNRAIRVISGWLSDTEFQDKNGLPSVLPMEGQSRSFSALVKKYSGDIPTRAMLTVLETAKAITVEDSEVRLIKHAYVPGNDPVDKIQILGADVAELVRTIDHNLTHENGSLRFQRKVSNDSIRVEDVAKFRFMTANKAQALLEEFDSWLKQHEIGGGQQTEEEEGKYVSLGIYFYERNGEGNPHESDK